MQSKLCSICFNETENDPCPICTDTTRNGQIIAVLEWPSDIQPLENQGFRGRYHVLHGVISPRDGIGPSKLRIRELVDRVWDNAIDELVVYLPDSQEGDATFMTIEQDLARSSLPGVKVTRLVPNW